MTQSQNPSLPQARVIVKHPYLSMMCLYFGGFTGMYSETALNIALPQLSLAFGVELNMVQWLVVAYMLVIGLVLPLRKSSYEMVHGTPNNPICSLLVSYRSFD